MQMKHQKLIYLDPEEKEGLENILKEFYDFNSDTNNLKLMEVKYL